MDAARVVRQPPQQQHAAVLQRQQPATLAIAVVVPVRQRHAVGWRRAGREAIDFGPGVLPGLLTPRLVAELGLVAPRSQCSTCSIIVRLTQCSTGASLSTVSPTGVYGVLPAHMASSDPSAVRTTCLVTFATLGWAPAPFGQSGSKFSSAPVAAAQ